jgi:hypothetical protein
MNSIVSYKTRGNGGSNKYRGNCSPMLIEDLYKHFGFKEISDYSCGSNTVGDVATKFGIKANTYDLNMGFDLINDDIKERNDFIFYHPAYWDIIKYSGVQYGKKHTSDISYIEDYKEFIRALNYCIMKQYSTLKTGARMAILVGDIKKRGKLYSMILDMIKPDTIENIVIKAQHNTWSERNSYTGNFIPIVHEYLLILRRDNPYIGTLKISKTVNYDIRDSTNITWKDLLASVLEKNHKSMKLEELYKEVENHKKAKSNKHFKEKIRQVLRLYTNVFKPVDRGIYTLV